MSYILTSSFLGAYFLKNPATEAKIKVDKPKDTADKSIVGTCKDADKKLLLMKFFGTEDDEIVQKLAKNERLCQNLETIKEMQKGEHAEIVNDLVNKSLRDDCIGDVARSALSCLTDKNVFAVPMIMQNVTEKIKNLFQ